MGEDGRKRGGSTWDWRFLDIGSFCWRSICFGDISAVPSEDKRENTFAGTLGQRLAGRSDDGVQVAQVRAGWAAQDCSSR